MRWGLMRAETRGVGNGVCKREALWRRYDQNAQIGKSALHKKEPACTGSQGDKVIFTPSPTALRSVAKPTYKHRRHPSFATSRTSLPTHCRWRKLTAEILESYGVEMFKIRFNISQYPETQGFAYGARRPGRWAGARRPQASREKRWFYRCPRREPRLPWPQGWVGSPK